MPEANDDMSQPDRTPPSKCQERIALTVAKLRAVLDRADKLAPEATSERAALDADICLASRSAYFAFYTWMVLNGKVDEPAAAELDALFKHSLKVMGPGEFQESVSGRYTEFKTKCDCVRRGEPTSKLASLPAV